MMHGHLSMYLMWFSRKFAPQSRLSVRISRLASLQGRQKPSRRCALPTLNMSSYNIQQAEIDRTSSIKNQHFTFFSLYSIKKYQIWRNRDIHVHEKHACEFHRKLKICLCKFHGSNPRSLKFQISTFNRLATVHRQKRQNSDKYDRRDYISGLASPQGRTSQDLMPRPDAMTSDLIWPPPNY